MQSRDFVYWLQGYFEILDAMGERDPIGGTLSSGQVDCIKRHLAMVFTHEIDPSMGPPAHQAKLDQLHQDALAGGETSKPESGGHGPVTYRC